MPSMKGLADQARSNAGRRGPVCQVSLLLQYLPGEDAEEVEKALADPTVTHTGLYRALQSRLKDSPVHPAAWSIGNHRRKNCGCFR